MTAIKGSTKFNFTDASLNRYIGKHPGDTNYDLRDTTTSGLYLRVRGQQKKQSWYLIKRVEGTRYKRLLAPRSLMPLPEARAAAAQLFLDLKKGEDPLQEKRETEAEETRNSTTLTEALGQMLKGADLATSTVKSYRRCIGKTGAFYKYRDTPLASITDANVIECHKAKSRQSKTQANKDCRTLRAVWNWGKEPLHLAGSNPVEILNKGRKVSGRKGWNRNKRRKTSIQRHQLPAWFKTVAGLQLSSDTTVARQAMAMELMVLTGLRRREVLRMQWGWIDWPGLTVTIPDESSKNQEALVRPLTTRVQQLLKEMVGLHPVWVFPSMAKDTSLDSVRKAQDIVEKRAGVWTPPNDLRRTFASAAPAAGIAQHTIKALMNHLTDNEVTEGYQVADLDTLRETSQKVEDFIRTEAGMLDRSLEITLTDLISGMADDEKRRLIFQLSDERVRAQK
jgi:integrase